MDINQIYSTIINEPIYLSIIVIFILISIYSILKKFFKILIIILTLLIGYIFFLIYTGEDLPGDSEKIINPLIDKAGQIINDISNQLEILNENLE
tara:strand:- start:2209 stop:2493 length:285 start_codon:yes stop_codon:yes gene_type:complete